MFPLLPFPFLLLGIHLSLYCRLGHLDDVPECVREIGKFGARGRGFHRSIIPRASTVEETRMSYQDAKKAFEENLRRSDALVDAKWKPYLWNLNEGLRALVEALEEDMNEIHGRLDRLEKGSKTQG